MYYFCYPTDDATRLYVKSRNAEEDTALLFRLGLQELYEESDYILMYPRRGTGLTDFIWRNRNSLILSRHAIEAIGTVLLENGTIHPFKAAKGIDMFCFDCANEPYLYPCGDPVAYHFRSNLTPDIPRPIKRLSGNSWILFNDSLLGLINSCRLSGLCFSPIEL